MSSLFELTAWDFVALVALVFVIIHIIRQRLFRREEMPPPVPQLPDMPKQGWNNATNWSTAIECIDFYTNELEEYDGRREDGRLLLACDGKVFDVSVARSKYGKDGPYNSLVRCFHSMSFYYRQSGRLRCLACLGDFQSRRAEID